MAKKKTVKNIIPEFSPAKGMFTDPHKKDVALHIVDPETISVGDMVELSSWGSWSLKVKGDYSKESRIYVNSGGTYLVMDIRNLRNSDQDPLDPEIKFILELWDPNDNIWRSAFFFYDGKDEATILKHIQADAENGRDEK
jgi:hypothetical protein